VASAIGVAINLKYKGWLGMAVFTCSRDVPFISSPRSVGSGEFERVFGGTSHAQSDGTKERVVD
jgi:hypothetical protein